MREQIEFSQTQAFQSFMAQLDNLEEAQSIIHGIFIDLHPIWKGIINFERTTGFDARFLKYFSGWIDSLGLSSANSIAAAVGAYDPERESEIWAQVCSIQEKMPVPFVVKIYVIPTTRATLQRRRKVEAYARQQPFWTVVQDAPMPILASSVEGGSDITATGSGTLGGFLEDQAGTCWGGTCGHVAQQAGQDCFLFDIDGNRIGDTGTVGFTNFPDLVPQSDGDVCNQYVNASHLEVDAALIRLPPSHVAFDTIKGVTGKVDCVYDRCQIGSGSNVTMSGAISGPNDYIVGGYGVTVKIQLPADSSYYCFSNVFEIFAPATIGYLGGRVSQALAPRPLPCDSGSWVCYPYMPQRYAYFGNLIAVMGASGIATFADAFRAWAQNECNLTLHPF